MDAAAGAAADIEAVPHTAGEEPRLSDAVAPVLESEAQMFAGGWARRVVREQSVAAAYPR
jgi:hypothetical protein